MVRTQPESLMNTSGLYVWGCNSHSELGLNEEIVGENKQHYYQTQKSAYLSKPLKHDSFADMVHQVACSTNSNSVLCFDQEQEQTLIVQMGMCSIPKEEHTEEAEKKNLIDYNDLHMVEDIPSVPF